MTESAETTRAFVADLVHDLQSPLLGMRTQLEVALAHSATPPAEDWVKSMLAATTQMEQLINDLLALADEERQERPLPREVVDLESVVHDEASRPRPSSLVIIDLERVGPVKVRGDENSLRRLVRNLVDNAVRHAEGVVRITLRHGQGRVVLDVVDDGPGVSAEHREHIFDRFYRANPERRDGTGLGLAIVRQAAQRHGGTVVMLPGEPGEGAHFRLVLPMPD